MACDICGGRFHVKELIQAFLRSPDDPHGSWTKPVEVDPEFNMRSNRNKDGIRRAHSGCIKAQNTEKSYGVEEDD